MLLAPAFIQGQSFALCARVYSTAVRQTQAKDAPTQIAVGSWHIALACVSASTFPVIAAHAVGAHRGFFDMSKPTAAAHKTESTAAMSELVVSYAAKSIATCMKYHAISANAIPRTMSSRIMPTLAVLSLFITHSPSLSMCEGSRVVSAIQKDNNTKSAISQHYDIKTLALYYPTAPANGLCNIV